MYICFFFIIIITRYILFFEGNIFEMEKVAFKMDNVILDLEMLYKLHIYLLPNDD